MARLMAAMVLLCASMAWCSAPAWAGGPSSGAKAPRCATAQDFAMGLNELGNAAPRELCEDPADASARRLAATMWARARGAVTDPSPIIRIEDVSAAGAQTPDRWARGTYSVTFSAGSPAGEFSVTVAMRVFDQLMVGEGGTYAMGANGFELGASRTAAIRDAELADLAGVQIYRDGDYRAPVDGMVVTARASRLAQARAGDAISVRFMAASPDVPDKPVIQATVRARIIDDEAAPYIAAQPFEADYEQLVGLGRDGRAFMFERARLVAGDAVQGDLGAAALLDSVALAMRVDDRYLPFEDALRHESFDRWLADGYDLRFTYRGVTADAFMRVTRDAAVDPGIDQTHGVEDPAIGGGPDAPIAPVAAKEGDAETRAPLAADGDGHAAEERAVNEMVPARPRSPVRSAAVIDRSAEGAVAAPSPDDRDGARGGQEASWNARADADEASGGSARYGLPATGDAAMGLGLGALALAVVATTAGLAARPRAPRPAEDEGPTVQGGDAAGRLTRHR